MPPAVATPIDPGVQQQQLNHRLAAVRRRLRFVTLFRGGCWLLSILLFGTLIAILMDWGYHDRKEWLTALGADGYAARMDKMGYDLSSLPRALFLVVTLTAAGYIFYRRLVVPFREKDDDLTLALRIEKLYPGLNDSFASAVEFLSTEDEHNSPSLRREAVSRGLRGVSKCDFSRLVNTNGLWKLGGLTLLAVLAILGLGLWKPVVANVAFQRFVVPFGNLGWPKKTRIELDPVPPWTGRNKVFEVSGRVLGVIPPSATVIFKLDGGTAEEKDICAIVKQTADNGEEYGAFHTQMSADRARRGSFRFRVTANDAETDEYQIEVRMPPELVPMDGKASPQVRITFPAYTQQDVKEPEPGSGKVVAVNGSVVSLTALADRPLASAWIEFRPEPPRAAADLLVSPLGSGDPIGALAVAATVRSIVSTIPVTLEDGGRKLNVTFTPSVSGNYILRFIDTGGLSNSRMFELNVFPDPEPNVILEHPGLANPSHVALGDATLELHVLAQDQKDELKYGVRHVWLEYRWKRAGRRDADPPLRLPLFTPGANVKERPQQVPIVKKVPLKDFKLLDPAAGPPVEGDILTIQACADDYDDVSAGKEPGRSASIDIHIVSPNLLEKQIEDAQTKIQKDLVILQKMQQDATKKVKDVRDRFDQTGKLSLDAEAKKKDNDASELMRQAEQKEKQAAEREESVKNKPKEDPERTKAQQEAAKLRKEAEQERQKAAQLQQEAKELRENFDKLLQAEDKQRQVRDAIDDQRKEGVRADVERIRETLRQNPLPRSGSEKRMDRVAEELDRLARDVLPKIESGLTNPRKDESAFRKEVERKKAEAAEKQKAAEDAAQRARDKEKAADALEQSVKDKPKDAPERKKAEDQTAAERKEAEKERKKAADLEKEARELRKNDLDKAGESQEEVEKTLADILNNTLDAFTSTQEVRGEAKALLEEQKRIQRQTEELIPKNGQTLPPQEQQQFNEALERLKRDQEKVQERTQNLLNRMENAAKEREKKDPATAQEMKDAAELGKNSKITEKMNEAKEDLERKHPGDAAKAERESVEKLQDLVKRVEDGPKSELKRGAQDLKQQDEELKKLQDEMEKLRKKRQEAEKEKDEKKRKEELQRLEREEKELQQKIQQRAEQLGRDRQARAAQAMQKADNAMKRMVEKLQRGEDAKKEEQEVLDRLQEARNEINQSRKQVEDQLEREELAKVADQLKAIKERQAALIAERERIQKELLRQKPDDWRALLISLGTLANNQGLEKQDGDKKLKTGLAKDLADLAEKKLDGAPVFAGLLRDAADIMSQAGQQLEKHRDLVRDDGKAETEAVTEAARLQKEALTWLEDVLKTLEEEKNAPLARNNNNGGQGGGGDGGDEGGGAGAGNGNEIPPLAQLKLLRQQQAKVNQRTEDFRKAHPDPTKMDDKAKTELRDIRKAQQKLADWLDELLEPDDAGGDKP